MADPVSIDVLPLPAVGRPGDFSGAVGSFDVSARATRNEVKVGESITLLNYDPNPDFIGLTVQSCEPEQLASELDGTRNPDNGNMIKGGIEVNQFGAPIAFWLYTEQHPLEIPVINP